MAVDQLPVPVRVFADRLRHLHARLDPGDGWCGVFWQRDPDGMRACLDGREIPPWDVVRALLHDLAERAGHEAAEREEGLARGLYGAALGAYDALPGAREVLADRLDVMLREQRYAAERYRALARALDTAAGPAEAERIRGDLAWVRDDHERASARCAELRGRIAELGDASPGVPVLESVSEPVPVSEPVAAAPARRTRRPRGARFAGLDEADGAGGSDRSDRSDGPDGAGGPEVVPPEVRAVPPEPQVVPPGVGSGPELPEAGGGGPRGARFAGAGEEVRGVAQRQDAPEAVPGPEARRDIARAVADLVRLRAQGRGGEAHAVLCAAVRRPPAELPLYAAELRRAGLAADWATLLWEAASLPPEDLVAAADALAAAGHAEDAGRLLRQGVARPAPEIAAAVLALDDRGRDREAGALLGAYLRVRTPEEAAQVARGEPGRLVPRLLDAARAVGGARHRDLLHALRVAGIAG